MYLVELKRDGERVYEPGTDMAMQNYVKQNLDIREGILLPYMTNPSVQIGRYQNAVAEINRPYMDEHGIELSRRDTGGGAIYNDRGMANFCFLIPSDEFGTDLNFRKMYEPVVELLHELGAVEVQISGRNDLEIDGRKISGAAMTLDNGILYGGFSLMLDTDYDTITQVLTPNKKKIESKGIKSNRSRVSGLRPYLDEKYQNMKTEEFLDLVTARLIGVEDIKDVETYVLTDEDWANIDKMTAEKYRNWDWNYGASPRFNYNRDGRIEGVGTFDVTVEVDKSRIKDIKFYGDYFGQAPVSEVEESLIGQRFEAEDVRKVLSEMDLVPYFNAQIHDELTDLIFS